MKEAEGKVRGAAGFLGDDEGRQLTGKAQRQLGKLQQDADRERR
ncbi:MAG TPA: hypothetical protein VNK43_11460 [Gemmatimonadales bacterium]|nr:hypothetical protein [Gemmatimonadales bacterium]